MKKCILSALLGAILMFLALLLIANACNREAMKEYEHIDYVSTIMPEDCFVCSEQGPYWGQDNVGIVDLNTFELLYLPINCYDDHGNLIEEPAGVMQRSNLIDNEVKRYVHAEVFPDNAFSRVDISGVQYTIDCASVQRHLCQNCLDSINSMWFENQPPAEYAVVSFAEKTIQPLLNTRPWFSAGNYGVACDFREAGKIDLLIHYAVNPYMQQK